jgi:hypothetical protein
MDPTIWIRKKLKTLVTIVFSTFSTVLYICNHNPEPCADFLILFSKIFVDVIAATGHTGGNRKYVLDNFVRIV